MDTRSRNFKRAAVITGSILFTAAAGVVMVAGCMLMLSYDLESIMNLRTEAMWSNISELWIIGIVAFFTALAGLTAALWKTGERDEQGRIRLNWFDRFFTDLQIGLGILAFVGLAGMVVIHVDILAGSVWYENLLGQMTEKQFAEYQNWYGLYPSDFKPRWLEIFFAVAATALLLASILVILLSLCRKLKAGAFWRHTIIGRLVCYLYDAAKASDDIFWKVLVVLVAGCLLSATWFGIIPVLILIFVFVPKWLRKYQEIRKGIRHIRNGDLDYRIPVTDNGELDRLAADINEISAAAGIAVQNELKNQRMKTDLISNVSHDLKTPLTSMVSYIDLLKTEGLDSPRAGEYLKILDEKTKRLQKLTEDLFEAAKASSGVIPVEMERIEMTSIANQALAELEERISASGLEVIFTNKAESAFVMADGQLLWRIMENLLVNACKYALAGSRVYMDILDRDGMVVLEIKNMSRDRLNISAEELMERFTRGDESRNTEGSGLGLSIARDLTKLMDGVFRIDIDGDLFKASVALKSAEGGSQRAE